MRWISASNDPSGSCSRSAAAERLLLDARTTLSAKRLAPVEGGRGRGQDDVEGGPVPDGPRHRQGLGRESPPTIDVPSPLQLDGDRGQEPSSNRRRLIGHAGERLLVEGEDLLVDDPDLRRSAEAEPG